MFIRTLGPEQLAVMSLAPQDFRYTSMDPSKPLLVERAPASRHQSRASSSQMTVTNPRQTLIERPPDDENCRDRHDVSHSYEEVTIRITRKVSQYHHTEAEILGVRLH